MTDELRDRLREQIAGVISDNIPGEWMSTAHVGRAADAVLGVLSPTDGWEQDEGEVIPTANDVVRCLNDVRRGSYEDQEAFSVAQRILRSHEELRRRVDGAAPQPEPAYNPEPVVCPRCLSAKCETRLMTRFDSVNGWTDPCSHGWHDECGPPAVPPDGEVERLRSALEGVRTLLRTGSVALANAVIDAALSGSTTRREAEGGGGSDTRKDET
jgi:hypothetical protein